MKAFALDMAYGLLACAIVFGSVTVALLPFWVICHFFGAEVLLKAVAGGLVTAIAVTVIRDIGRDIRRYP
jgi:hypothetical protein